MHIEYVFNGISATVLDKMCFNLIWNLSQVEIYLSNQQYVNLINAFTLLHLR